MTGLDWLEAFRQQREAAGLRRSLHYRDPDHDGLLDLASNDYLGLQRDPRVVAAAAEAATVWGAGSGASRLVTGSTQLHRELEQELAAFTGTQSALVVSSGYLANLAVITALTTPECVIVSDASNHASIIDACRLATGQTHVVAHCDPAAFAQALSQHRGTATRDTNHLDSDHLGSDLLVTDAIFSAAGDAAPVAELADLARTSHAVLVVDEAHALGVVGHRGQGAAAAAGLLPADDIVMTATLSKALAAQGGVVMGSQAVIDHLIDAARPVIFDTALAPPSVAAALAALRIVITEPDLPNRARANAAHLAELATSMGLTVTPPDAAVVGITIGSAQDAVQARDICAEHGVRVGCFRPPSVPDGQSLLRLTARANLSEPDLARTAAALAAVARSLTGSS
ncbi:MAG TPA: 8-amino-7-oxononanoate synthase [Actinobacteria bacterium]|nr:8-amino-7-oxononanoate synthase [Actinomycetota bacterium]